jgi:hypothetical protein
MGADLTRIGAKNPLGGFEVSDRAVKSGYFRDAYNACSILQQYGLSWWRDITPLQDDDGVISNENLKKFKELLEKHKWQFEDRLSFMTKEWQKSFKDHSRLLHKFLDDTIEAGGSVEASL